MRFSYNFKNIFLGTLLIVSICLVLSLLLLKDIRTSYLATHFPLVYVGLFVLFLVIGWYTWRMISNFEKGDDGEMKVHRLLANLPSNYYSLHDVTLSNKGNIDEVVIAPAGIWTIEVKNCKDGEISFRNNLLCINGSPLEGKDLKQAYAEAEVFQDFIREFLGLYTPVSPVLVFANPKNTMQFGFHGINGVQVIGFKLLIELLQEPNMPNRLTPEQCVAVRDEIKKYTRVI